MDHRTHERGIGMLNTPYVKKDTIKNFFPIPNAVFDLGLHHMEINIYAYPSLPWREANQSNQSSGHPTVL